MLTTPLPPSLASPPWAGSGHRELQPSTWTGPILLGGAKARRVLPLAACLASGTVSLVPRSRPSWGKGLLRRLKATDTLGGRAGEPHSLDPRCLLCCHPQADERRLVSALLLLGSSSRRWKGGSLAWHRARLAWRGGTQGAKPGAPGCAGKGSGCIQAEQSREGYLKLVCLEKCCGVSLGAALSGEPLGPISKVPKEPLLQAAGAGARAAPRPSLLRSPPSALTGWARSELPPADKKGKQKQNASDAAGWRTPLAWTSLPSVQEGSWTAGEVS